MHTGKKDEYNLLYMAEGQWFPVLTHHFQVFKCWAFKIQTF